MPYFTKKGIGTDKGKTCVYKKSSKKKVGCTAGPVEKYLTALRMAESEDLSWIENIPSNEIVRPWNGTIGSWTTPIYDRTYLYTDDDGVTREIKVGGLTSKYRERNRKGELFGSDGDIRFYDASITDEEIKAFNNDPEYPDPFEGKYEITMGRREYNDNARKGKLILTPNKVGINENDELDWIRYVEPDFNATTLRYGQIFKNKWGDYIRTIMFIGQDDEEVSYEKPMTLLTFKIVDDPSGYKAYPDFPKDHELNSELSLNPKDFDEGIKSGRYEPIFTDKDFKLKESSDFDWIKDVEATPNYQGHPQGVVYLKTHKEIEEFFDLLSIYGMVGKRKTDIEKTKRDFHNALDETIDRFESDEWDGYDDWVPVISASFFISKKDPTKYITGYWDFDVDEGSVDDWIKGDCEYESIDCDNWRLYKDISEIKELFNYYYTPQSLHKTKSGKPIKVGDKVKVIDPNVEYYGEVLEVENLVGGDGYEKNGGAFQTVEYDTLYFAGHEVEHVENLNESGADDFDWTDDFQWTTDMLLSMLENCNEIKVSNYNLQMDSPYIMRGEPTIYTLTRCEEWWDKFSQIPLDDNGRGPAEWYQDYDEGRIGVLASYEPNKNPREMDIEKDGWTITQYPQEIINSLNGKHSELFILLGKDGRPVYDLIPNEYRERVKTNWEDRFFNSKLNESETDDFDWVRDIEIDLVPGQIYDIKTGNGYYWVPEKFVGRKWDDKYDVEMYKFKDLDGSGSGGKSVPYVKDLMKKGHIRPYDPNWSIKDELTFSDNIEDALKGNFVIYFKDGVYLDQTLPIQDKLFEMGFSFYTKGPNEYITNKDSSKKIQFFECINWDTSNPRYNKMPSDQWDKKKILLSAVKKDDEFRWRPKPNSRMDEQELFSTVKDHDAIVINGDKYVTNNINEENDFDWIQKQEPEKELKKSKKYVVDVSHLRPAPMKHSHDPSLTRQDILRKLEEIGYDVDHIDVDRAKYFYVEPTEGGPSWQYNEYGVPLEFDYWVDYNTELINDPSHEGEYQVIDVDEFMFLIDNNMISESRKPINEVAGISFEARKWAEIIYNEIISNPEEKSRLIIDGYDHPEAFDGFPIDYVVIDYYDRLTGYGQEHSGYDKDGNYVVLLYVQPKLVSGQGGYSLQSALNHEMKHAWEDYNRLSKGLPSIEQTKESQELYNRDYILMLSDQNVRGPIKEILKYYYYLSNLEKSAYLENVYDQNPAYERVVRDIASKDFESFKDRFDLDVNWHLMNTAYNIPFLKKFKSPREFIDYSAEELRSRALKMIKKINKMRYVHGKM